MGTKWENFLPDRKPTQSDTCFQFLLDKSQIKKLQSQLCTVEAISLRYVNENEESERALGEPASRFKTYGHFSSHEEGEIQVQQFCSPSTTVSRVRTNPHSIPGKHVTKWVKITTRTPGLWGHLVCSDTDHCKLGPQSIQSFSKLNKILWKYWSCTLQSRGSGKKNF